MNRFFAVLAALVLLSGLRLPAQTSLDVIQDDLREAKEQHDEANSQVLTAFVNSLQQASQSPSAALDLYQKAGGSLPDTAPVQNHYDYETPTEKAAREAIDLQNDQAVAVVIQVHCGLMEQATMLTLYPNKPDVRAQWLAWLKSTAETYPQLAGHRSLKDVAMRDSVVSQYLGFHSWGTGEPGGWAVRDLPRLYHDLVLEPLRHPPTPDTLDAWDTYIAMRQADETDHDKWTGEEEPDLGFERASDDFAIVPSMDKLATLDAIVKGNPTNDHLDEWMQRMQAMIDIYRSGGINHSPLPTASPGSPSSDATGVTPTATPGTSSSEAAGILPTATPGSPSTGTGGPLSAATPGTPSAGAGSPTPTATPGTPSSGNGAPTPTATPGTPSSGGSAPP